MKSFTRYSVLLVAFCMMIGQVSAGGDTVYDFSRIFNGQFVGYAENPESDPLQPSQVKMVINTIPVTLPHIRGITILAEQYANDQILRRHLWLLSSGGDNIVTLRFYYLPTTDSSRDFDRDAALADIRSQDFNQNERCVGTFVQLWNGWFTGGIPDCSPTDDGIYAMFGVIATCNSLVFNNPPIASKLTPFIPYVVNLTGNRYPVPGIPPSYKNQCEITDQ